MVLYKIEILKGIQMEDFKIENQSSGTFLVYNLKKSDELDTFCLGMMTNNRIAGFAPVSFVQMNSEKYFKYNISSKVSIKQFVSEKVKMDQCIKLILSIVDIYCSCDAYMINTANLITEYQAIFVNVSTCEVYIICLPLLLREKATELPDLIKSILMRMTFVTNELMDYPARIINSINNKDSFDILSFIDDLKSLLKEGTLKKVNDKQAMAPEKTDKIKKRGLLFYLLSKRENISRDTIKYSSNFAIPEIMKSKQEKVQNVMKSEKLNFGDTSSLDSEYISGETVLLENSDSCEKTLARFYITRISNGEEKMVTAGILRIGTEKSYVDFCLEGNPSISRSHADVLMRDNLCFIIDNNSTNHTYIDGVQVTSGEEYPINEKSEILLANEKFKLTKR